MSDSPKCPSIEQLELLNVGRLPETEASLLEEHLMGCESCAQQTARIQKEDTLVAVMKQVGTFRQSQSPQEESRVERLIDSVRELRTEQADVTLPDPVSKHNVVQSNHDDDVRELSDLWQPSQMDDEIGRMGEYRILKLLGSGGMGAVFLAEDSKLHRLVALKLMRPRVAARPDSAERFLREARAAAALRHDHILTIYQVGETAKVPYLAAEYLEGESLEDRLRRNSPLPTSDVLRIGREIAEGLTAAHEKGLIHRDIKPANVWLENRGTLPDRVKLLDFGLARSVNGDSDLTSTGMILGTPSYMAPEQASCEIIDVRADLFSLGVVLYRMTTGRFPFPGTRTMEILQALATVIPASPSSINSDVPPMLSGLIDQMLAKDRDRRPATAAEVAKKLAAVEAAISERKTNTQPLKAAPSTPRNRSLMAGFVVTVLLCGIWVIVKNKKGEEIAKINVPDEGVVIVSATGNDDGIHVAPSTKSENKNNEVQEIPRPDVSDASKAVRPEISVERNSNDENKLSDIGDLVLSNLKPGPIFDVLPGIIPRPARLPGLRRWQVTTVSPTPGRHVIWSPSGQIYVQEDGPTFRTYDATSLRLCDWRLWPNPNSSGGLSDVSRDGRLLSYDDQIQGLNGDTTSISGKVMCAEFSPNGKLVAGWTLENGRRKLKIVSLENGETVPSQGEIVGGTHVLGKSCEWSPDSLRVCLLEPDQKTLRIFNLDGSDGVTWDTQHPNGIYDFAWNSKGDWIATSGGGGVKFWKIETSREPGDGAFNVTPGPVITNQTEGIAWHPDGKRLAVCMAHQVEVFDTSAKSVAQMIPASRGNYSVAWSPNGHELVSVGFDGLHVWREDGRLMRSLNSLHAGNRVQHLVAWSSKGQLATRDSDRVVRLWSEPEKFDSRTEPLIREIWQHDSIGEELAWSHDGNYLATSRVNPEGLRIWNTIGQPVGDLYWGQLPLGASWMRDNESLISYNPYHFVKITKEAKVVRSWDTPAGHFIRVAEACPSGDWILSGYDDGVRLWKTDGTPGPDLLDDRLNEVRSVSWHPTRPIFAAGGNEIRIGETTGKWLRTVSPQAGGSPSVLFSPDGRWLAYCIAGRVTVEPVDGGQGIVFAAPAGRSYSISWSPDSRFLALGLEDHRVMLRDVFAEKTKWIARHLPPVDGKNRKIERRGGTVVFSESGELLHLSPAVPLGETVHKFSANEPPNYESLDEQLAYLVEETAGKIEIVRPSEFKSRVETAARRAPPVSASYPVNDPIDLLALTKPAEPDPTMVAIPRFIDGEYDIALSVTAPENPEFLAVGLVQSGHPFELILGQNAVGLTLVDGKTAWENETLVGGRAILPGKKNELLCQVRNSSVIITVNGEQALEWKGDPKRLSIERRTVQGQPIPTVRFNPGNWLIESWTLTPRESGVKRPKDLEPLTSVERDVITQLLDEGGGISVRMGNREQWLTFSERPDLWPNNGDFELIRFEGEFSDRMIPLVAELKGLKRLTLRGEKLTDEVLEPLAGLKNLEDLSLHGTSVFGRGLKYLAELPNLKRLAISAKEPEGSRAYVGIIDHLNRVPNLVTLELSRLGLTDGDLARWQLPNKLKTLGINGNDLRLTENCLSHLPLGPSLMEFAAGEIPASEASFVRLANLLKQTSVTHIWFNDTSANDDCLKILQELPHLRNLEVLRSHMTQPAVEAFRKARPECQIHWSPRED